MTAANSGRDVAKEQNNKRNKVTFKTPFAFAPVPGTASAVDLLLRICGFDVVHDAVAKTSIYTPAPTNSIDTAYAEMRSDRVEDTGVGHEVKQASKGLRGTFDLNITIGERIVIENVVLQGTYIEPSQVPPIDPDFGVQKDNLSADTTAETVITCTLGGNALCFESLLPKNVGGLEISQSRTSCADSTDATEVTPTATIVYQKPNFDTEFSPYAISNTDGGIQEHEFILEINSPNKGKLRFECARVQALHPERTEMKNKKSGFSHPLSFLSDIKITLSEAD